MDDTWYESCVLRVWICLLSSILNTVRLDKVSGTFILKRSERE